MSSVHVRIITPVGIYRELDTPIVNVDTVDGQEGILPGHMPLVTMLDIGRLKVDEDGVRNVYAVAGGLLYFRDDKADILTDAVENARNIDTGRAERAKNRAEQRLSSGDPDIDLRRAEVALKKAVNRIDTAAMK